MSDAPATSAEVARRLGASAPQMIGQLRRLIGRMLDRHSLAADLFLDDAGMVKPAAAKWFEQLAQENYVNGGAFDADAREHAYREGRRSLALEILRSALLDVGRLGSLTKLEREME